MVKKYVIKKYENRKLYDPNESETITLDRLFQLSGDNDVMVIDKDGKDITLPSLFEAATTIIKKRFVLGHIKGKDFKFLKSTVNQIREVLS